jgi:hypothetical protein
MEGDAAGEARLGHEPKIRCWLEPLLSWHECDGGEVKRRLFSFFFLSFSVSDFVIAIQWPLIIRKRITDRSKGARDICSPLEEERERKRMQKSLKSGDALNP